MAGQSHPMTFEILRHQDDVTSNAILKLFHGDDNFHKLAASEGEDIIKRDKEDETKLAVGIQIAIKKGVLPADSGVGPITQIDVAGKSADAVTAELLSQLQSKDGNVIILQGLSGTGKGTTVKKLQQTLPHCMTWSNGNVFRTITYLVTEHCAAAGVEFSPAVLTSELLSKQFARLTFERFDDGFDVVIDGKIRVADICNTKLKEPVISQRVPTVAEQTQGEVVKFASAAVETLTKAGHNVILEGRGQTLQYIHSPYRFELVIPDAALLGQRRAAQRVMAAALKHFKPAAHPTPDETVAALKDALHSMVPA